MEAPKRSYKKAEHRIHHLNALPPKSSYKKLFIFSVYICSLNATHPLSKAVKVLHLTVYMKKVSEVVV